MQQNFASLTVYSFPLRRCSTHSFPMMKLEKQFPKFRKTPSHKHEKKKRQLAAHVDYSNSAECRTEIFDIFGIFFCCIPVLLFIYSTIFAESLNVFCWNPLVPQNCACKTLLYVDIQNVSAMVPEEEPDISKDVGRVWLADRNFKILYCGSLKMYVNLSKPTGYFTY